MTRSVASTPAGTPVLAPLDAWLSERGRYALAVAAAIACGCVAQAAMWRTHFFADDVDFFAGMCVALQNGAWWDWLRQPGNGHFSMPTKLAYFAVWRWLGRDVFWWHILQVAVWSTALVAFADWSRRLHGSRAIAATLTGLLAVSGNYRAQLMDPPAANHLVTGCMSVIALGATSRLLAGHSRWWLGFALAAAFTSFASTATGILTFVLMLLLSIRATNAPAGRRWTSGVLSCLGLAIAAAAQRLAQDAAPSPDLRFGLIETARGLWATAGRLIGGQDLSRIVCILSLVLLVRRRRQLNPDCMLLGGLLLVLPLLLATTFRAEFPGIGRASRYALLPTVGAMLWLGELMRTASIPRPSIGITPLRLASLLATTLGMLAAFGAARGIRSVPAGPHALFELESRIGNAVARYADSVPTGPVPIPTRNIALPASPDARPLDHVARYCVPPKLMPRIAGVPDAPAFDAFVAERWPELASMLRSAQSTP